MKKIKVKFKVKSDPMIKFGRLCDCKSCDFKSGSYFIYDENEQQYHNEMIEYYKVINGKSHLPAWW